MWPIVGMARSAGDATRPENAIAAPGGVGGGSESLHSASGKVGGGPGSVSPGAEGCGWVGSLTVRQLTGRARASGVKNTSLPTFVTQAHQRAELRRAFGG